MIFVSTGMQLISMSISYPLLCSIIFIYLWSRFLASYMNMNFSKTASRSFKNVAKSEYFVTIKNQNLINEKIKSILNSSNACYHSVQNLLSSHLLSKNEIQNYHFACSFVWVINLVSDIKGRTQALRTRF
jgi:hypothetical protein